MRDTALVKAPYSQVFLCDPSNRQIPVLTERPFASNETCLTIGTWPEQEGATTLVLAIDESDELLPGSHPDFSREFPTPSGRIGFEDVYQEQYLVAAHGGNRVRVKVWINHPTHPDRIVAAVTSVPPA
jgi:hypothetical protein